MRAQYYRKQHRPDHMSARAGHCRQLEIDHLGGKNERTQDPHQGKLFGSDYLPDLFANKAQTTGRDSQRPGSNRNRK